MSFSEPSPERRSLLWGLAVSLLIHGAALFIPRQDPAASRAAPARLEARLGPRVAAAAPPEAPAAVQVQPAPKPRPSAKSSQPTARPRLLTAAKSRGPTVASSPKWSVAERSEMNRFLDELAGQAKAAPKPTLAQRSLAMAREQGRELEQQAAERGATLERIPNSPPPDPFSLDMYVDGLIKRLNRSSAFVRNDPRAKGMKVAAVQFRVNPDGTLKSFVVLNAADQQEEIAFIEAVVRRSAPFSPFPADITQAAKSLAMTICILPTSGGGFGFSRSTGGRGC